MQKEKLTAADPFSQKLRKSFETIAFSHQYVNTLMAFKEAFTYRAQYPWLGESGTLPGNPNGVVYALAQAITGYIPESIRTMVADSREPEVKQKQYRKLDAVWQRTFLDSLDQTLSADYRIYMFANALTWGGVNPVFLDTNALTKHVAGALEQYVKASRSHTSSDPW